MKKILLIIVAAVLIMSGCGSSGSSCPHQNEYGTVKKVPVGIDREGNDIYKWYCTKCEKYVD